MATSWRLWTRLRHDWAQAGKEDSVASQAGKEDSVAFQNGVMADPLVLRSQAQQPYPEAPEQVSPMHTQTTAEPSESILSVQHVALSDTGAGQPGLNPHTQRRRVVFPNAGTSQASLPPLAFSTALSLL